MMIKNILKSFGAGIFILALFVSCDRGLLKEDGPIKIAIQPFGDIDQSEVDSVKIAVSEMFDFELVVLPTVPLPERAYTEIRYPRYRADTLVLWLSENIPDSVDKIIGLTDRDISVTKYTTANKNKIKEPEWQYKDFGIFGLGRVGGNSCVVSSNRLHKNVSEETFFVRLKRITCHEVGHTLGLRHCPTKACLMNDANESIKTIDNSTGVLCNDCKRKI